MRYISYAVLLSLPIFFFSGCGEPGLPKDQYNMEECKEELLEANDFKSEGSIDHIIVEKAERKMYLYKGNEIVGVLPVSLGKTRWGINSSRGTTVLQKGSSLSIASSVRPGTTDRSASPTPDPRILKVQKKEG